MSKSKDGKSSVSEDITILKLQCEENRNLITEFAQEATSLLKQILTTVNNLSKKYENVRFGSLKDQKELRKLLVSEKAQEMYIKKKTKDNEEVDESIVESFRNKWKELKPEKKNKWIKKADIAIPAPTSKKTSFKKKPLRVSAYQAFSKENLKRILTDKKLTGREAFTQNALEWNNMGEQEKKQYQLKAVELSEKNQKEYSEYVANLSTEERHEHEMQLKLVGQRTAAKKNSHKNSLMEKQIMDYLSKNNLAISSTKKKKKHADVYTFPGEYIDSDGSMSEEYAFVDTQDPTALFTPKTKLNLLGDSTRTTSTKKRAIIDNDKSDEPARKKPKKSVSDDSDHKKKLPSKTPIVDSLKKKLLMTDASSDEKTTSEKKNKSILSSVKNIPKVSSKGESSSSSSSDSDSSSSSKPTTKKSHNQSSADLKKTKKKIKAERTSPVKNIPKVSSKGESSSSSTSDSDSSSPSKPTTTKSHNQSSADLKKTKKKIKAEKVTVSNEERTSPVKNIPKVSSKGKSSSSSSSDSDSSSSSKPLPSKSHNQSLDSKKKKKENLQSSDSTKSPKKTSQKTNVESKNPFVKELIESSESSSESEKEATPEPSTPKKSKFTEIRKPSVSSDDSSSSD